jgi:hypothetical protein
MTVSGRKGKGFPDINMVIGDITVSGVDSIPDGGSECSESERNLAGC